MTYAGFLFLFLVLPSVGLAFAARRLAKDSRANAPSLRHHIKGTAILALIAFIWTTPWDNYLIASGVWNSPEDKILGRVGYVPLEEYAFFILMTVWNALLLYRILPSTNTRKPAAIAPSTQRHRRIVFTAVGLALFSLGLGACLSESGRYLGLILVWFVPPLLVQWLYDPTALLRQGKTVAIATLLPTAYFSCADALAIQQGIWQISADATTGLMLSNLPVEEIIFFFTTSLLIAQGLILWHSRSKTL